MGGGTIAVDAAFLALEKAQDELWDDLLRVLAGPVDVVAARDDDGQLVGTDIGLRSHKSQRLERGRACVEVGGGHLADELGGGLGARVGVGWLEDGVLHGSLSKHVAVHLQTPRR